MKLQYLILTLMLLLLTACSKPVDIIEPGYTADGRVDMMTREGDEIFQEDCREAGISVDSFPLPDREANTRELMR